MQAAATIEQQLGKYASVSVTYLNARGEHQLMLRDFPNLTPGQLDMEYQSGGVFRQNQINTKPECSDTEGHYHLWLLLRELGQLQHQ